MASSSGLADVSGDVHHVPPLPLVDPVALAQRNVKQHLALRHLLRVQRQILITGHVPEKFVQNLSAGESRQVPEN